MQRIKGMVQVGGETFRIERVHDFLYEVVRIHDDRRVGTFQTNPVIAVVSCKIDPMSLQQIARAAVQGGKTSWARRLEEEEPLPASSSADDPKSDPLR